MTMAPFDQLFPDLARSESRSITVVKYDGLLPGPYLLRETYCVEPGCDCRRVLLQIWNGEPPRQVATLNYAFEPPMPPFEDEGQLFIDPLFDGSASDKLPNHFGPATSSQVSGMGIPSSAARCLLTTRPK